MAHTHSAAATNKRRLAIVLGLTSVYLLAEVVGGLLTHSLALLADAGHMLTDVAGLGLALLAVRFAERPATPESLPMLLVAAVGLVVNLAGIWVMRGGSTASLNMKGAYYEVLSDALASVGVIVAGLVMLTTGWYYADPILSAAIGLFILPRTWKLLMEAVGVLLEGTPSNVNIASRTGLKSIM